MVPLEVGAWASQTNSPWFRIGGFPKWYTLLAYAKTASTAVYRKNSSYPVVPLTWSCEYRTWKNWPWHPSGPEWVSAGTPDTDTESVPLSSIWNLLAPTTKDAELAGPPPTEPEPPHAAPRRTSPTAATPSTRDRLCLVPVRAGRGIAV